MLTGKRTVARGAIAKPHGLVFTRGAWRWEPSARWRAAGHKGFNLTNADGSPCDQWQAIERAAKWNEQLVTGTADPIAKGEARTFDALCAEFIKSARFNKAGPRSQRDYRYHIKRLSSADHFGGIVVAAITPVQVENHFAALQKNNGVRHGKALYETFCTLIRFAVRRLKWIKENPCDETREVIEKPVPRKQQEVSKIWTAAEIVAFIRCAEWLDRPCQADAIVLALGSSQSVSDVLAFPNLEVRDGFIVLPKRRKTRVPAFAPASPFLLERIARMNARRKAMWPDATFDHQLIYSCAGDPYSYCEWQQLNRALRLLVAGDLVGFNKHKSSRGLRPVKSLEELPFTPQPSLAVKKFSDLRATSLTRYTNAGGPLAAALIAGHSLGKAFETNAFDTLGTNYWQRQGAAVAATNAHHAFDDIQELLRPRPRPVKAA